MRRLVSSIAVAVAFGAAPSSGAVTANVCVTCHEGLPGDLSEPVPLWKKSIHAASGIFCNDCHGGDASDTAAAMTKERGFIGVPSEKAIPEICGRCHPGVKKDFAESRHGKALGRGGPTCVTCHGNHGVVRASLDIITEERCSKCHDYRRAETIKAAMKNTEEMIVAVETELSAMKRTGMETGKLEQNVFAARNRFHTLFHDVDVRRVREESGSVRKELDAVEKDLAKLRRTLLLRKEAGGVVVSFFLVSAGLLTLLRKSYDNRRGI